MSRQFVRLFIPQCVGISRLYFTRSSSSKGQVGEWKEMDVGPGRNENHTCVTIVKWRAMSSSIGLGRTGQGQLGLRGLTHPAPRGRVASQGLQSNSHG